MASASGPDQQDQEEQQDQHPEPVQEPPNLQSQVKMATILMICFIAEHNLPFMIADHLTELCKVMFPDSAIAQSIHMKRTKCTELTKKIAAATTDDLVTRLRKNHFSVIIDETTDISKTKCLTVVVKYYDTDEQYIKTRMLDLINIFGDREQVGSTAEALFRMLIDTLTFHQIHLTPYGILIRIRTTTLHLSIPGLIQFSPL